MTALALTVVVVDADVAGHSLTTLALGLAALDAATGVCLGCMAYRRIRRPHSS